MLVIFADKEARPTPYPRTRYVCARRAHGLATRIKRLGVRSTPQPCGPIGVFRDDILAKLDADALRSELVRRLRLGHQWPEEPGWKYLPQRLDEQSSGALMASSRFASWNIGQVFRNDVVIDGALVAFAANIRDWSRRRRRVDARFGRTIAPV